jgi:hypothetical protein
MIFKDLDSKEKTIHALENLLKKSQSEKQKALIKQDIQALKNGYEAEKQNAYYIDFYLNDSKNIVVLHDIRIQHNGQTAQIDHMLISRFGIELLESKSFTGETTINDDLSITVKYNGKNKSFENPIEQSKRHAKILHEFINKNFNLGKRIEILGGFPIDNIVLLNPKTTITNKKLPQGFFRADSYISKRVEKIDNLNALDVIKFASKMIKIDTVKKIANFLVENHTPLHFDYEKKYKVPNKTVAVEKVQTLQKETPQVKDILTVGSPCPFCKSPLVLRNATKDKPFLGCSSFPKCRFTRRVTKEEANKIVTQKI